MKRLCPYCKKEKELNNKNFRLSSHIKKDGTRNFKKMCHTCSKSRKKQNEYGWYVRFTTLRHSVLVAIQDEDEFGMRTSLKRALTNLGFERRNCLICGASFDPEWEKQCTCSKGCSIRKTILDERRRKPEQVKARYDRYRENNIDAIRKKQREYWHRRSLEKKMQLGIK